MTERARIQARAQRQVRASDAIRLHILSNQIKTMRWTGPVVVHTDLPG